MKILGKVGILIAMLVTIFFATCANNADTITDTGDETHEEVISPEAYIYVLGLYYNTAPNSLLRFAGDGTGGYQSDSMPIFFEWTAVKKGFGAEITITYNGKTGTLYKDNSTGKLHGKLDDAQSEEIELMAYPIDAYEYIGKECILESPGFTELNTTSISFCAWYIKFYPDDYDCESGETAKKAGIIIYVRDQKPKEIFGCWRVLKDGSVQLLGKSDSNNFDFGYIKKDMIKDKIYAALDGYDSLLTYRCY